MSTSPKTFSAFALSGALAVGVVCGAMFYYFFMKSDPCEGCCPDDPGPPAVVMTAFFDSTNVEAMTGATDSWGVRFYLAKNASGALSVLAAPIMEDGKHISDASGTLQFRVFKAISGESTDMDVLDEARAVSSVRSASTTDMPTWSLDVKTDKLVELLRVADAKGVGLNGRRTTSDNWSYDLAPVRFASDQAYLVGSSSDILLGADPCPLHCPKETSYYLHMRP